MLFIWVVNSSVEFVHYQPVVRDFGSRMTLDELMVEWDRACEGTAIIGYTYQVMAMWPYVQVNNYAVSRSGRMNRYFSGIALFTGSPYRPSFVGDGLSSRAWLP